MMFQREPRGLDDIGSNASVSVATTEGSASWLRRGRHGGTSLLVNALRPIREPDPVGSRPWLDALGPTDRAELNRLARLGTKALGAPASVIVRVDGDGPALAGGFGLPESWPADSEDVVVRAISNSVEASGGLITNFDTRSDPSIRDDLLRFGVVSCAGAPLLSARGDLVGAFVVIDFTAHNWSAEDVDALRDLAAIAMAVIERHGMARGTVGRDSGEPIAPELAASEQPNQAEVERALRARDEFLALVSHDLKNPLTAIRGRVQLLQRSLQTGNLDPDRFWEGLAILEETTARMTTQIDELLDLARLHIGEELALERGPVDLVALARELVDQQQQGTQSHRLLVDAVVPRLVGNWDAFRLERVLGNLLSNAIKYSPSGGDIVVRVAREEGKDGPRAVLEVEDHGVGIPAADLPHIFERFHRGENVVGRFTGSGIGLAGARRIVEQHGGLLSAKSEEGVGSTFTLRLPLSS